MRCNAISSYKTNKSKSKTMEWVAKNEVAPEDLFCSFGLPYAADKMHMLFFRTTALIAEEVKTWQRREYI